jgi:hypothetical protein
VDVVVCTRVAVWAGTQMQLVASREAAADSESVQVVNTSLQARGHGVVIEAQGG